MDIESPFPTLGHAPRTVEASVSRLGRHLRPLGNDLPGDQNLPGDTVKPATNPLPRRDAMLFGGGPMLLVGTLHGEWLTLDFNGRTLAALVYLVTAGSLAAYI